ncbi:hypothetical protein B4Q13_22015 [Lacticaseibacillus rhamnosus]
MIGTVRTPPFTMICSLVADPRLSGPELALMRSDPTALRTSVELAEAGSPMVTVKFVFPPRLMVSTVPGP